MFNSHAAWYGISEASFKHCGPKCPIRECKESTFISCTDADQSWMEPLSLCVFFFFYSSYLYVPPFSFCRHLNFNK